jgi:hypothetical protein
MFEMANTIDTAFITQFEADVHLAYQRGGSKLQATVRNNIVSGDTVQFHKLGSGTAVTKGRNSDVTPMELAHTNVSATMADYYASEYVDKLDELKTNMNERQAVATSAAWALGRKTDEIIITAMQTDKNATILNDAADKIALADFLQAYEQFGINDVPDDGQRYIALNPQCYADALELQQFTDADYVGDHILPGGTPMRMFLGFKVFSTSAVTAGENWVYHSGAVGLGINAQVSTEINYVPQKAAHLITSMMSMGAKTIDTNGVYELEDVNT